MQLKIQRSQRAGGLMGGAVFFCLDVRADYSPEEKHNIRRYALGGQLVYSSHAARKHSANADAHLERTQSGTAGERWAGLARGTLSHILSRLSLNISIASLGRGHHIECRDLQEMLDAEDLVRGACKNVTKYLEVASSFDGSETVIEYDKGEERIHIAQHAPPLLDYEPNAEGVFEARKRARLGPEAVLMFAIGRTIGRWWRRGETAVIAFLKTQGVNASPRAYRIGVAVLAAGLAALMWWLF